MQLSIFNLSSKYKVLPIAAIIFLVFATGWNLLFTQSRHIFHNFYFRSILGIIVVALFRKMTYTPIDYIWGIIAFIIMGIGGYMYRVDKYGMVVR